MTVNKPTITQEEFEEVSCEDCDGDGFNVGHDPRDPHENGCSNCPIRIQCETCQGEGTILITREQLKEQYDIK